MSRLRRHRILAFTRDGNGNYLGGHLFRVARTFHSVGQMVLSGLSSDPVSNPEASCVAPAVLQHSNGLAFGVARSLDVALRGAQRGVPSELLDIP